MYLDVIKITPLATQSYDQLILANTFFHVAHFGMVLQSLLRFHSALLKGFRLSEPYAGRRLVKFSSF